MIWNKTYKKIILELVDNGCKVMNLNDWKIVIVYKEEQSNEEESGTPEANCDASYRYKEAILSVEPILVKYIKEGNIKKLNQVIFHELGHCLTDRLYKLAMERFTSEREITDEIEILVQYLSILIIEKNVLGHTKTGSDTWSKILAKRKK